MNAAKVLILRHNLYTRISEKNTTLTEFQSILFTPNSIQTQTHAY